MKDSYDMVLKIVMVGDSGVGKSSLLVRYSDDIFDQNYIATIGVDFRIKTVERNGKIVKLQIWDTAGQDRFKTITQSYYRGAHACMLCFDLTDKLSFENLNTWISEVKNLAPPDTSFVLIGTKADLPAKRVISHQQAADFANHFGMKYCETSSKTATNITDCFEEAIDRAMEKRLVPVQKNKDVITLGDRTGVPHKVTRPWYKMCF
jgi:Ras-related protein Rab-1A